MEKYVESFTSPIPYIGVSLDTFGMKTVLTAFPLIPQSMEESSLIAFMSIGIRKEILDRVYGGLNGMIDFKGLNVALPGIFGGIGYVF